MCVAWRRNMWGIGLSTGRFNPGSSAVTQRLYSKSFTHMCLCSSGQGRGRSEERQKVISAYCSVYDSRHLRAVCLGNRTSAPATAILRIMDVFLHLKPRPHQQQRRSNVGLCRSNSRLRCQKTATMSNEFFVKFRPIDKVETNRTYHY